MNGIKRKMVSQDSPALKKRRQSNTKKFYGNGWKMELIIMIDQKYDLHLNQDIFQREIGKHALIVNNQ